MEDTEPVLPVAVRVYVPTGVPGSCEEACAGGSNGPPLLPLAVQDGEFHWEVAGIKLMVNRGTLVRNNHIAHLQGGAAIWLDWDNQNSRITGNVMHDINTVQGAVFIEASQSPNQVDHNVSLEYQWGGRASGRY